MTESSSVIENGLNLLSKHLYEDRAEGGGGGGGIQCSLKTEYTVYVVISKFVI